MIRGDIKLGNEDSPPPTQKQSNLPSRILVVEDDGYMRELIVKTLVRSGYEKVDAAANGDEAWTALLEVRYQLVITDHVMPKVTGLDLIKKMRAAGMLQPVILVSGTIPTAEIERNPGLRVDAILFKPFTVTELLATIAATMQAAGGWADEKKHPTTQTGTQRGPPVHDHLNAPFRILFVDDNHDTRQMSIEMLVASGYDVEGVEDGVAGWEAILTHDYDLVITDNQMPRMTGLEMIEKLNSAGMTIPIIMATANLPTEEFIRRPWLKPDATLQRPFSSADLLAMVRNVLETGDGG